MDNMTKKNFLTIRWNNILSFGLGFPTLLYIVVALSTSMWMGRGGLIGLVIFGALFWLVVELHTTTRFAWLRENQPNHDAVKQQFTHPFALVRLVYNAAFWIFLIPFFTMVEYNTGFIAFSIIIFVRFGANLYTNNVLNLTPAQYEGYPFRI